MILKPLFTNILVKPLKETEGTIVTELDPHEPIRGLVMETGIGKNEDGHIIPMQVHSQMIIYFYKQDARLMPTDEGEWYVLDQRDILVVEED